MTKAFKFNWHIPVPIRLQEGVTVDRWTEVSTFFWILGIAKKKLLGDDGECLGFYLYIYLIGWSCANRMERDTESG